MKRSQLWLLWGMAVSATGLCNTLPGYDFSYQIKGDAEARPNQVFDDGMKLYMQFSNASILPVVYTNTGDRDIRLRAKQEFPYVVVDGLPDDLQIRVNGHTAFVRYDGHQIRHPGQAVYGIAAPAQIPSGTAVQKPGAEPSMQPAAVHGAFRGEMIFEEAAMTRAATTQSSVPAPMLNQNVASNLDMTIRTGEENWHRKDINHGCEVQYYRVVHGDSAWKIAHANRIRLAELVRMNHLGQAAQIRVGQMIVIPVHRRVGQQNGSCRQNQTTGLPDHVLPVVSASNGMATARQPGQFGMETLSLHMSGNLVPDVRRRQTGNGMYRVNELIVR